MQICVKASASQLSQTPRRNLFPQMTTKQWHDNCTRRIALGLCSTAIANGGASEVKNRKARCGFSALRREKCPCRLSVSHFRFCRIALAASWLGKHLVYFIVSCCRTGACLGQKGFTHRGRGKLRVKWVRGRMYIHFVNSWFVEFLLLQQFETAYAYIFIIC